jgi:hypothetical protein
MPQLIGRKKAQKAQKLKAFTVLNDGQSSPGK